TGLGSRIEAALRESGARVVTVATGERFSKMPDAGYRLNPAKREDYDLLVADLVASSEVPDVVAHLWCVTPEEELAASDTPGSRFQDLGFFSLVYLVQALEARGLTQALKLAVVTTQVHEVNGGESLSPDKAMALAPCKVIGMEYPGIRVRAIDVTLDGDPDGLVRALMADLRAPWTDPVVAYRGRYRWVQGFEKMRIETPAAAPLPLRESGAY